MLLVAPPGHMKFKWHHGSYAVIFCNSLTRTKFEHEHNLYVKPLCFGHDLVLKLSLFLVFAREHWQVWGQVWLWLFGSALGTSSHETPTQHCCCPAAEPTRLLLFRLHSAMSLKGIESHRQYGVLCLWSLHKLIGPLCSLADHPACRDFTHCPTCGTAGSAALQ